MHQEFIPINLKATKLKNSPLDAAFVSMLASLRLFPSFSGVARSGDQSLGKVCFMFIKVTKFGSFNLLKEFFRLNLVNDH